MKIPLLPIQTLVIFLISLTVGACLSQSGYDSQSWFILSRNFILLTISNFVLYSLPAFRPADAMVDFSLFGRNDGTLAKTFPHSFRTALQSSRLKRTVV